MKKFRAQARWRLHRWLLLAALAFMGSALAQPSSTQEGKIYAGGALDGAHYDIDYASQITHAYQGSGFAVQSAGLDRSSDFAYKAFVGYRFVPQLSAELAYVDLGRPKAHYDLTSTPGLYTRAATYRIQGANLAAVGAVPITDALSLHAMMGIFYSRLAYSGRAPTHLAPNRTHSPLRPDGAPT